MATVVSSAFGVSATGARASAWRRDRVFFMALPIAMMIAVFVGFGPTYYLKGAYRTPALSTLYHLHGLLFTSWMVLLIGQAALVAARRTPLHRRLGILGGVLAGAMMITALAVTIDLGRRGAGPPGIPPIQFMIVPFSTLIVFPVLVGAALWLRRRPDTHKRLMLIATMELTPAAFGRWAILEPYGPPAFFGMSDAFLLAIVAYDLMTRRRVHSATVWGGLFLLGSQGLRVVFSGTDAWQDFGRWLIS
jgi:hypothetical protein